MNTIAFFNNKGGIGTTTLIYHLAWMMTEQGKKVLTVDLDPQANLSSMFLPEETLETIWPDEQPHKSILACIEPILNGTGDIQPAHLQKITGNLHLIAGDPGMSLFEDKLSDSRLKCLEGDNSAFRAVTAFYRIMLQAAKENDIEALLIDIGPNPGAIARAALIAAEHIVIPLAPGLYSLQGLKDMGTILEKWRKEWKQRLAQKPEKLTVPIPDGNIRPTGYIIIQHTERRPFPFIAFQNWAEKIPQPYRKYILNINEDSSISNQPDNNEIGRVKNYQSLLPMAHDAGKPIFSLKPAEGAIGAHAQGVTKCYLEFKKLAENLLNRTAAFGDAARTPF